MALFIALSLLLLPVYAEEETDDNTSEPTETADDPVNTGDRFILNGAVRPGEEITVSLCLELERCFAVSGRISFDNNVLTFIGSAGSYASWNVSSACDEGNISFLAIDPLLANPAEGETVLFDLVFMVDSGALPGSEVKLGASSVCVSDGSSDVYIDGFSVSAVIERALGTGTSLLSINAGAELTPAFSSDVHEYSLTVADDVTDLELEYTSDEYAVVSVSDSSLEYGENTIFITVSSEKGDQTEEYVLHVTRSLPYIPSSDSALSGLTLSEGTLIPSFSKDMLEYAVLLREGSGVVTITPSASSELASAAAVSIDLSVTDHGVIECTAEDGSVTVYAFTVYDLRAVDNGPRGQQGSTGDQPPVDPPIVQPPDDDPEIKDIMPLLIIGGAVIVLIVFALGFLVAFLAVSRKNGGGNKTDAPASDAEKHSAPAIIGTGDEDMHDSIPGIGYSETESRTVTSEEDRSEQTAVFDVKKEATDAGVEDESSGDRTEIFDLKEEKEE